MPVLYRFGSALMIDHTPSGAVSAGDVVVVADECRIAHADIEANMLGALAAPSGSAVYSAPKEAGGSGKAIADGGNVYWDATNKRCTNTDNSAANKIIGTAVAAALTTDTVVRFRHI